MFRRIAPLFAIMLILSLVLVACGDDKATVPTYSGGTSVTLPSTLQPMADSLKTSVKESSVTAFKTADSADKVKSSFADQFKKDGWDDKASTLGSDTKSLEVQGAFILLYQKGSSNAAAVVGFPAQIATALGVTDVAANGSIYIVISGKA